MDLEKFVRHFGFRVVNIKHHNPYQRIDMYNSHDRMYYTKPDIDTTVEMEIDQRRLEHLANYFEQSERLNEQDRDEAWLRRQHPGLKDAYDKYKMLLALYK